MRSTKPSLNVGPTYSPPSATGDGSFGIFGLFQCPLWLDQDTSPENKSVQTSPQVPLLKLAAVIYPWSPVDSMVGGKLLVFGYCSA
ncbi:hypothetical protein N7507_004510 [Penicillium longicatenatum]|nr:hypothetical protein N7507_004510 [Penicillium longicatenatum]